MQTIEEPLTIEDFEKPSIVVISKVEIDSDGEGNFQELPDIKTYNINTNEENRVAKFCSYSFNISCLNTDNRYFPLNSGSSYYGWLKQGRRMKIWAGLRKDETEYPYQLILGRIDNFKLSKRAGQDICTITGRGLMRMVLDFKLYSPNTYWGTSATYNTVANKIRYDMEADCKGVYRVFLDSTSPYDGNKLEEIYENTDWSYDWHNDQLVFTPRRIPDFPGTNNLKVYYFQEQSVEDVVADILISSGILQAKILSTTISFLDSDPDTILGSNNSFVTAGLRSGQIITVVTTSGTNDGIYTINTVTPGVITLIDSDSLTTEDATTAGTVTITTYVNLVSKTEWLASSSVIATNKTIDRVWFNAATSALKAITLLSEVVQYRFYFDYAGNPIFRPKPSAGSPVNTISDYETKFEDTGENVEEVYTHVIVIGEERDRILGEDEIAPDVPTGLSLSTGLGSSTQASLSWIKAEWGANTESDFGHYELRIKKTADSDYAEVSTIDISFIWYGLEPGVDYSVQIRAVDIYNNRSNWSTTVTKVTATDETTPAQITGVVATAILAGIRAEWNASTEDNIAGYIVERQESDDGTTWTGEWIERVRILTTMWMDLLLPYAKFYRYRIKAFTQTGVEGTASTPTADSIAANKAGANDIVAKCITADQIYGNKLSIIFADMGSITAGDITLNSSGFIRTSGKTSYDSTVAGFWLGYSAGYKLNIGNADHYLKWTGSILDIKGKLTIGGSGTNDEIYFKDSQLYLYDDYALGYYRMAIRRGETDYFRFYYWTGGDSRLEAISGATTQIIAGANMGVLKNIYGAYSVTLNLIPDGGTHSFSLYGTGTLKYPGHENAPSAVSGSLAYMNVHPYKFFFYNTEGNWEYFLDGSGW